MFCTRMRIFASLMTPVASETEISSTSPLGSMPSSAADDETTESYMPPCRSSVDSKNSAMPSGMMSQLVKRVTLFIESSSSECTRFSRRTSLMSELA